MKKSLAILLSVLLLASCLPLGVLPAVSVSAASGITGDCTWVLNGTHLTISGKGAMEFYLDEKVDGAYRTTAPWGWKITSVTIEEGVTTIGQRAFSGCDSLTSVTIPSSITTIGNYAFSGCDSLTSVYISDLVAWCRIEFNGYNHPLHNGTDLYLDNRLVTDLVIPDSVTTIGNYTFSYCDSLTSVTIPDSVTTIRNEAFSYCDSLISVTIGDSVTDIGEEVFRFCDSLTSVTIGDSVTTIGRDAFYNCGSLTAINADENNPNYSSIDGVLFNKEKTTLIQYPGGKSDVYSIPDGTITIGERAFISCTSLTSVTIPDSVTTIGERAFSSCNSLTSVTIPDSVTTIGSWVFSYCDSLTSVTIPDSVTDIENYAFYECTSLTSVYISDLTAWCRLELNNTSQPLYNGADLYLDNVLLTDLVIPDGVTTIGDYTFSYCDSLTSVTIPDSVTTIGKRAFSHCTTLLAINVDENNPNYCSVDGVLFNKEMTTLIRYPSGKSGVYSIPDTITTIEDWAFYNCVSLPTVIIYDSITDIGDWAFFGCTSLTDVHYVLSEGHGGNIEIGSYNDPLLDADWHYIIPPSCDHVYDDSCDIDCNTCQAQRTPPHAYADEYDDTCDTCGQWREVPEKPISTPGDVDGNGKVNNRDLAKIQQYITGWIDEIDVAAADVDGNGKINNRDLAKIQQYITGWITEL